MTATELVRTVARRELALARASIDLLDRQLGRLGGGADVPRQVLRRVRDVLEPSAGTPSDSPVEAAVITREREPRDSAPEHSPDAGSAILTSEEQDTAQTLAEEYLDEEDQHLVGELAEDEELRRVQAELRAKHALQEQDEQRSRDA